MSDSVKPRRPTVRMAMIALAAVAVASLVYAGLVPNAETAAALAVVGVAVAKLGDIAVNVISLDAETPFDHEEAAHKERLATIEADEKKALAWHNLVGDIVKSKDSDGANRSA